MRRLTMTIGLLLGFICLGAVALASEVIIPAQQALLILDVGVEALVTDVETGVSYRVRRVGGGGVHHADVETLTAEDTEAMKSTYGGNFSWDRRAILIEVDGRVIAASIAAMPHSGRDDFPYGVIVDNRSGGSGRGLNLNSIQGNNLTGVVDIYFYNSLIPGINRVCERHQHMVMVAAEVYQKQLARQGE